MGEGEEDELHFDFSCSQWTKDMSQWTQKRV